MHIDSTVPALGWFGLRWSVQNRVWSTKVRRFRRRGDPHQKRWDIRLLVARRVDGDGWLAVRATNGKIGHRCRGYGRTRADAVRAWIVAAYEGWLEAGRDEHYDDEGHDLREVA